ncbi:slit homolog 2 protein-like [Ostrea edulis]|uniref:slit homolog 2 protein-like n=1 Tax=Ostrea edulis TaxID=37623 RepID=UPI0024AFA9D6|nr:slit homolog 2 protein-like [Ostrea edulis]
MKRENGSIIYTNMSLPSHTRPDLLCPKINEDNVNCTPGRKNHICTCFMKPMWKDSSLKELTIEYINRKGGSRILYDVPGSDSDLYHVSEPNSFLTLLPSNLCSFPNIVKINFTHNKIRKLEDIGCIHRLHSIDLSFNKITNIPSSLFRGLSFLSIVNLSNNDIHSIEPGSFNDETLGLIELDVSHNSMLVLDASNFILPKTFCRISYANNQVHDFSNKAAKPITETDKLGDGGYLDFSNNHIQRIPNPKRFNVRNGYSVYGKLSFNRFIFKISGNPLSCDCFLEEFLWQVRNIRDNFVIDGDTLGYTCYSPLSLRDTSVVDLIYKNDFDSLVCQLHHCPEGCSCTFQSSKYIVVVNCTNSFDRKLPDFNFTKMIENVKNHTKLYNSTIRLHMSSGFMKTLNARDYLVNISYIDLSNNSVEVIAESALSKLSLARNVEINLVGNKGILRLPKALELLKPDNILLSNTTVICDCDLMSWILPWLKTGHEAVENLEIVCKIEDLLIPLENVTNSDLKCDQISENYNFVFLAGGLIILIIILFYLYQSYGEYIFVFYKCTCKCTPKVQQNHSFKYDVYISIDEHNEQVLRYVIRSFIPMLQTSRLKTFLLVRDSDIGGVTEECVIKKINDSGTFVFFLTSSTSIENGSIFAIEWRHAWRRYKSVNFYDIVLINFDLLRMSDIKDQRIKAISAVGHSVHFSDIAFSKKVKTFLRKDHRMGKFGMPRVGEKNSKAIFNLSLLDKYDGDKSDSTKFVPSLKSY